MNFKNPEQPAKYLGLIVKGSSDEYLLQMEKAPRAYACSILAGYLQASAFSIKTSESEESLCFIGFPEVIAHRFRPEESNLNLELLEESITRLFPTKDTLDQIIPGNLLRYQSAGYLMLEEETLEVESGSELSVKNNLLDSEICHRIGSFFKYFELYLERSVQLAKDPTLVNILRKYFLLEQKDVTLDCLSMVRAGASAMVEPSLLRKMMGLMKETAPADYRYLESVDSLSEAISILKAHHESAPIDPDTLFEGITIRESDAKGSLRIPPALVAAALEETMQKTEMVVSLIPSDDLSNLLFVGIRLAEDEALQCIRDPSREFAPDISRVSIGLAESLLNKFKEDLPPTTPRRVSFGTGLPRIVK